jgi:hypothetical protein
MIEEKRCSNPKCRTILTSMEQAAGYGGRCEDCYSAAQGAGKVKEEPVISRGKNLNSPGGGNPRHHSSRRRNAGN